VAISTSPNDGGTLSQSAHTVTLSAGQAVLEASPTKAAEIDMATENLAPLAQPGAPLYGIEASNHGRLILFAGGIPLVSGSRVVGAIGVSSGSVEQDQEVAEAGAAAF
jgi:uncharacterized protein GlcG (DUF336 family)